MSSISTMAAIAVPTECEPPLPESGSGAPPFAGHQPGIADPPAGNALARNPARGSAGAAVWRRFVAAVLDSLLVAAMLLPVTLALVWSMEAFHSALGWSEHKSQLLAGNAIVLLWVICHCVYCAWAESSPRQATWGKRLLHLKVVSVENEPIGFDQATWRHLAKFLSTFVLFAGFAVAIFHRRKQCLHDIIAGTLVLPAD